MLNQPTQPVGIVGYGAYVPRYRLPGGEISRIWNEELGGKSLPSHQSQSKLSGQKESGPIKEKAAPGLDEDTVTMSIEAARNALARAAGRSAAHPGRMGRQREPSICGQTDGHDCGRGDRRHTGHAGGGLAVRMQSRDRGDAGRHWIGGQRHGMLCAGDRHGYGAEPTGRRAGVHGGGRWRGDAVGCGRRVPWPSLNAA